MSSEDYEELRDEERVWARLQRSLCMAVVVVVWTAVVVAMMIMVDVVFAVSGDAFPFCQTRRLPSYHLGVGGRHRVYSEEEAVDAFWLVGFYRFPSFSSSLPSTSSPVRLRCHSISLNVAI